MQVPLSLLGIFAENTIRTGTEGCSSVRDGGVLNSLLETAVGEDRRETDKGYLFSAMPLEMLLGSPFGFLHTIETGILYIMLLLNTKPSQIFYQPKNDLFLNPSRNSLELGLFRTLA